MNTFLQYKVAELRRLVQNPRPADNLRKYKKKQNPKNKDFILRICFWFRPYAQMKVNYKYLIIKAFYMYIYELKLIWK